LSPTPLPSRDLPRLLCPRACRSGPPGCGTRARSSTTSNGEPLGRVLEARLDRLERRLDGVHHSIGEVREWLAFREERERPPFWTPRSIR
jgi:hypothetical protein